MAGQMRPIDAHLGFVGIYKESFGLIQAHPKKLLLLALVFILPLAFFSAAVNQALESSLLAEGSYWDSSHPGANASRVVAVAESASELALVYLGGPFTSWPRHFLRPVFQEAQEQDGVEVQHFSVLGPRRKAAAGDYEAGDGDYAADGGGDSPTPPDAAADGDTGGPPLPSDYEDPNQAADTGSAGEPPPFQDPNVSPPPAQGGDQPPPTTFEDPNQIFPPPAAEEDFNQFSPPPAVEDFNQVPPPPTSDAELQGPPVAGDQAPVPPATPGDEEDYSNVEDPASDPFATPPPPFASSVDESGGGNANSSAEPEAPATSGSSHLPLIIFLYICSFSLLTTLILVPVVAITGAVAGIYGTKFGVGHIWQPLDFYLGDILRSLSEAALKVLGTGAIVTTLLLGSLAAILQVFRSSSIELQIFLLLLYAAVAVYVTSIWSLALAVVVLEKPMTWGFKPLIRSFHLLTAAKRVWLALGLNVCLSVAGGLINSLASTLARALTANGGFEWSFLYVLVVSLVMTAVIFITLIAHTVFFCVVKARCDTDKDGLQNVKYVALSEKSSNLLEEGTMKPKAADYEDELDDI